ncbi:MAG: YraN family protein [Candidatus Magasanikbacteria bacterium]|uniref:UPF0102 protein COU30_02610 n=1 Tax=Candidatus Magasanikbacteria bacterium CG10_big_fil_rev_8_21_14_0_10_38_6 TaxID=1974647 RepID=A0A2M6P134_9BACT|nr:YraN family protein [Candidatus Magasanikbacteria bacterium]NCS71935.1 YraN family protein [Candidatus Magasanikbacteria bacterium]PIR77407.1 MAG: YraN family protein [Candidatus Magasanikbacteria bacterium CG10_big_fil_rev_8_21_14_0_10_38_6]
MNRGETKKEIGVWGEQIAATYLQEHGYCIAEQNFFARGGEIDIIAWHTKELFGRTLCFIEVKTRSNINRAAEQATQGKKLQKIIKTAQKYCAKRSINIQQTPIQFEHISIYKQKATEPKIIHHIIPIWS